MPFTPSVQVFDSYDLVTIMHDDGQFIVFKVEHDPTVGQFTTYDVSSGYADWGHDRIDDRDEADLAHALYHCC